MHGWTQVLEILTGKGKYFPGFVSLICAYLDFIQCDEETHVRVKLYLNFLIKRASGNTQRSHQSNPMRAHTEVHA